MANTLEIGVEMSLYPLNADYIPPIQNFIDRLNAAGRFKIITNSMSTQVFGSYDDDVQRAGARDAQDLRGTTRRRSS